MTNLYLLMRRYLAVFLILGCFVSYAQQSVSGKITASDDGSPLPGVNVLEKGTSNGTVSDASGNYSITVGTNATLVFTFIGYATQEVSVSGRSTIDVVLASDVTALEEIVVTGYGEQKKSLVTGAISSVKSEEFKTMSVGTVDQALQGRASGIQIVPVSGQPGSASAIRIRGIGSNGSGNPLFIVDGVRTSADGMNYLSNDDISSIEVLKDAASSAIYGSDGANGVIIITTKKGRVNKGEVTFSSQFTQQSLRPSLELMNQDQYIDYLEEAKVPGRPTSANTTPNPTDWIDVAFDDAPIQNHTLSFTGGTEKSALYISAGYFSQQGILGGEGSKFERYSFRVNSNHKINKWLNVGENFAYTNIQSAGLQVNSEFGGVMGSVLSLDPLTPTHYTGALPAHAQNALNSGYTLLTDPANGQYYGVSQWITGEFGNPLITYDINKGQTAQNKILGNVFVDIEPISNLKFTSRLGIDAAFQRVHTWLPSYYYSVERFSNAATGGDFWNEWYTWQWENFATYDKQIGDHHFAATIGTSLVKYEGNSLNGSYTGFFKEEDEWSYPNNVPPVNDRINGGQEAANLWSQFVRVTYDYKDKYLLNVSVRRDGSSKLADGQQVKNFPAVSLGWIVSNEDFFANISNIINYAKVRGSWGQNGNQGGVGIGQWKNSISNTIAGPIRYPDNLDNYQFGAAPTQAANPDLTWETSEQLDFGFDLGLLDNKLTFTFDWFNKTTKDLITPGSPPGFVGIGIPFVNAGTVENKGIELDLGYNSSIGSTGIKYGISANFTSIQNEVTELNEGALPPAPGNIGTNWNNATRFTVGDPIWSFWGYQTNGIFQNQAQIDAYIADNDLTGYAPVPGDPIVVNANGDNLISPADFVKIGSPSPTFYYGARVNLSYKAFDFMVFLQGQGGNDVMMGYFRTDRGTANKPDFFYTDRWTGENSTNSWFRASTTGTAYTSDLMIQSGNFMKIRQLQFGYTLPSSINEKLRVKNLRIYVSFDNFFVFTKYKGFDPEIGFSSNNTIGVDRGTYPSPRKLVGGLSLTF